MNDRMANRVRAALAASAFLVGACGAEAVAGNDAVLVHLADEFAGARVESASVPAEARAERFWGFDEPRPEWQVISSERFPGLADVELETLADGVRLALIEPSAPVDGLYVGGLAIELDAGAPQAWTGVLVRARAHERLAGIGVACNVLGDAAAVPRGFGFFMGAEGTAPVFSDGSVQTYHLPLRAGGCGASLESVGVFVGSTLPASVEILSIALVPRGADFQEDVGVRAVTRDAVTRHTLFAHTPAALTWTVAVPAGGRLDLGLACLPGEKVAYAATVQSRAGEPSTLLEETLDGTVDETPGDAGVWRQSSLDLSRFSGSEVELTLRASSERDGAVALFGAPILSGSASPGPARRPNVVFYVIDGGGADFMSLYGYNRRTTPFLEELAQEGVVFEHAYSNSTWTQPSTASFMTSLHHSVLGGLRRGVHSTAVPAYAVTMAEHMRRGGYQTATFTSNPNAARVIGLERGVDVLRDTQTRDHSRSSAELHEWFWRFRADYPGTPYWVHFQTTDVHEPNEPRSPFAGLFVAPEERERLEEWDGRLWDSTGDLFGTTSIAGFYDAALERSGVDRQAYFNVRRGLYDETMAHQDRELARFVARLKAAGEWENTLLVIGSDHGHPAGTFARFGRGLVDPQPEPWQGALFDAFSTHVPLVFVWSGRIEGGRRIEQPVSMIDVLPTLLELVDLPPPAVLQGRSLAPLLFGRELAPAPVVLDEFRVDEATGEFVGNLEVIDGRWGASLEIGPRTAGVSAKLDGSATTHGTAQAAAHGTRASTNEGASAREAENATARGRHSVPAGGRWGAVHPYFDEPPRLLLYDLWNDPFALREVGADHPELVERYERQLLELWESHRTLAQRFGEAGDAPLTPEVLRELEALGYVR